MKKLLSILLASIMIISTVSMVSVSAAKDTDKEAELSATQQIVTSEDGAYQYRIITTEKESYAVLDKALQPDATRLELPDKINGVKIIAVGTAFKDMKKLKRVILGKYVHTIGKEAFKECSALKMINLDNIVYFGKESFSGCNFASIDLTEGKNKANIEVDDMAFYNCKRLFRVKIYDEAQIGEKAFGYYEDGSKKYAKVHNFRMTLKTDDKYGDNDSIKNGIGYCHSNDFDCVYNLAPSHTKKLYMWAGFAGTFTVKNKYLKKWSSSNSNILKIDKKGNFVVLKKGTVTLKAQWGCEWYEKKVTIRNNPSLAESKIRIKKGNTNTVRITGKANGINNTYSSSKIAQITSKKSAGIIKVKGLKKGTTTLKIKVNKAKTLKLKVTVI